MAWLEDLLANLQVGGNPPMFAPAASPFPNPPAPVDEAAMAAAAREAAGQRMIRANQRRVDPFGVPDMGSAGVLLALDQAPAGTGVPGVTGAGAPDGSVFGAPAPFGLTVPPSLKLAQAATEPPPPAPEAPPAGAVPMPRPRPEMAPPATDLSSQNRPAPAAAPVAPAAMPAAAEPSIMDRLKGWAPGLIAAGAALQGDNSVAASMLARKQALEMTQEGQNLTARALLQRGAPAQEVAAATRNPELMKALVKRYFETNQAQNVGGMLVRERPDGKIDVLLDNTPDKAPKQRELKLPTGFVQQQEYVNGKWENVGEPAPGERDRRMSVSDIQKLAKEGGQLEQVRGFGETFKPEYAGYGSDVVGNLANEAGRKIPGVVGKKVADGAAWWQDYDRYKNVVRHGLYGASLTGNEQKAFLAADITPGMDPDQIRRNLATQKRIVEDSIRREGRALIGSTYDKTAIANAYGLPPSFFDEAPAAPARSSGAPKPGNYVWRNGALVPQ